MQEQTLQLEHQAKLKVGKGGRCGAAERTRLERTQAVDAGGGEGPREDTGNRCKMGARGWRVERTG